MKNLTDTRNKIINLKESKTLTLVSDSHYLNDNTFFLEKDNSKYTFVTKSDVIPGVQDHKELHFEKGKEYTLTNESENYYFDGSNIFLTNIDYTDDNKKIVKGVINALSTVKDIERKKKLFKRFILPLEEKKLQLNDFEKSSFTAAINDRTLYKHYIKISAFSYNFEVYEIKLELSNYIFIDCDAEIEEKVFQKICFNILLAIAFIKGNLYHNEAYIFGYEENKLENAVEISYYSMNVEIESNNPIFTTNMYNVYREEFNAMNDDEKDTTFKKSYQSDVYNFDSGILSNLINLLCQEEKVQRTAILFLYGHIASLEVRLPNYFVALEAITSYVVKTKKKDNKRLNPIKDNEIAQTLISDIIRHIEKYTNENNLTSDDINIEILKRKLDSFNSPPNADKLSEPFALVGYNLTDEQSRILKQRNSFLHGSFVKFIDDDAAFKEALYVGLRVQFLISVLVLKSADFSGKIINYAKLWDYMTDKKINENKLIKI
jgi:hypothetical protein